MNNITLVSIHIPKTGGSTFTAILKHIYADKLQLAYGDRRDVIRTNPQCFHGHKIIKKFSQEVHALENAKWITFLRKPLNSAISSYYYHLGKQVLGLEQWLLHSDKTKGYNHNRYNKRLEKCDKTWEEFAVIGVTEYYAASLNKISELLNWPEIDYQSKNIGSYTPPNLSADVIAEFEQLNQQDYILYRNAVQTLLQK